MKRLIGCLPVYNKPNLYLLHHDDQHFAEKVIFLRLLKNAPAFAEAASRRQADAS